ncbi:hypothetical protein RhiirA5_436226 [Rhizophagus irregularis]|uniref:Uncharacterized protein n=1 Tax=Rhizophagus irregularis TaxID=588596 RepID=A0A2N0NMB6_9GLOM|nr:hypothetical protein RhiirA5_436226 [Rhizophagus irregularis]
MINYAKITEKPIIEVSPFGIKPNRFWQATLHPIINILKDNLPIFNDYFVENFYSSIRNQTAVSNSAQRIIQKAKIIDVKRTNNFSFKNAFVNSKNPTIIHIKLDYLEKKVSLFLLSLFNNIYHNIGNNTETKPSDNKFCDAKNCLLSDNKLSLLFDDIVLTCEHSMFIINNA